MNYLSVCSGIEAATVAWHPLGWRAIGFSEIEKFPSQVLAHHYPDVPNLGDMTKFKEWNLESNVDVFVGGTPCQSFSVAGLRKGLDDPRGNLMLTYLAIVDKLRPKWLVWENVCGVLSSNGGKDFGTFLGGLGELGYGFAYRVLDAQYFGVAQRRRRVFVVGYLGDWRPPAAVLFERHSLCGNSAPRRETRKGTTSSSAFCFEPRSPDGHARVVGDVSPTLNTMSGGQREPCVAQPVYSLQGAGYTSQNSQGSGWNENVSFTLNCMDVHGVTQPIPFGVGELPQTAHCLRSGASKADKHESTTYIAQPISFDTAQITSAVNGTRVESGLPVSTLAKNSQMHVAYEKPVGTDLYNGAIIGDVAATISTHGSDGSGTGPTVMQSIAPTLTASNNPSRSPQSSEVTNQVAAVHAASMAVRRLTPVECERLQGFPDNYTNIKTNCPDGPRYKALGNSMAVPVMAWIGKRIQEVENINASR